MGTLVRTYVRTHAVGGYARRLADVCPQELLIVTTVRSLLTSE